MNRMIKRLNVVLLAAFMMMGVVSTPVHAEGDSGSDGWNPFGSELWGSGSSQKEADPDATYISGSLEAESINYKVKVTFDESAKLQEGTYAKVTELLEGTAEYADAKDAVETARNAAVEGFAAFDITLYDKDNFPIEPAGTVTVSVEAKNIPAGAENLEVQHITEDESSNVVVELVASESEETEGTIEVSETQAVALFNVDGFSTFVLTWGTAPDTQSATIHWGTYTDGSFKELTQPTAIDSTASTVKLDVIIDAEHYYFVGAEYVANADAEPKNLASTTLTKADDGTWQIKVEGNQTVTVVDGSNIYVNYAPVGEGGYTPPPKPTADILAPETEKTVTNNEDGTFTIQLDIVGKEDEQITQIGANVIVVMDITQSMTNIMPNSSDTRMAAAKRALTTLVNTLDPDTNLINFTAVNFAISQNGATLARDWTTQKSDMTAYVNSLPDNPDEMGTNWKAGLQGGISRVENAAASATLKNNETYVIFVTDGNPNCYTDNNGGWHGAFGPGFSQQAYNAAVPFANTLGSTSHFYGVFVGDADGYDHLEDLITGASGEDIINGVSTTAIEAAFEQIAQTIVNNLGAGSVTVDDGIPTLSNVSANVSAGAAGGFEYFITPKNGTQSTWTDAPGASYSNSNGVTWNLSEAGTLKDGWVYTLKFTVWPSQAAYDLIADLNNGIKDLDDLTDEQLASIDGNKEDGYTLKTNTHLYTTFKDLKGQEYRVVNDAKAKAMNLPTTPITITKVWNNDLDARAASDVRLSVTKDKKPYLYDEGADDDPDKIRTAIPMSNAVQTGENEWTQVNSTPIYISMGQIKKNGSSLEVLETGHDYTVTEPENFSYNWELTSDIYHPMVIDGDPVVLIEVDKAELPEDVDQTDKTYTESAVDGKEYYMFNGNAYVVQDGESVLKAVNDRRSNLNLTKVVEGTDDPEDALFTYTAKLTYPQGIVDDIWFSIQDENGSFIRNGDYDVADYTNAAEEAVKTMDTTYTNIAYHTADETHHYNYYTYTRYGENLHARAADDGTGHAFYTGFYHAADGAEFTLKIRKGWNVRFTNLPNKTQYEITETGMPAGFQFRTATAVADRGGASGTLAGQKISGTIDKANNVYTATFTNKYLGCFYVYHSADNTVEKVYLTDDAVTYNETTQKYVFDIYARVLDEVRDGTPTGKKYLYGGYYKAYLYSDADKAWTVDANWKADEALNADGRFIDKTSAAKPYVGERPVWDWDESYNEADNNDPKGTEMNPEQGETYYLKEVPTYYLMPYTHYTYYLSSNQIANIWYMSNLDDSNYDDFGYKIIVIDPEGTTEQPATKAVGSLKITNKTETMTLRPADLYKQYGMGQTNAYLAYYKDPMNDTFYGLNRTLKVQQYWVTPDGITVYNPLVRTITVGNGKVGEAGGITFSDN